MAKAPEFELPDDVKARIGPNEAAVVVRAEDLRAFLTAPRDAGGDANERLRLENENLRQRVRTLTVKPSGEAEGC